MAAELPRGLHDHRTRVTFLPPLNDNREEKAVHAVIRYLQAQRESRIPLTGFTYSMLNDPVFTGFWWSGSNWVPDRVVLFIIDYALSLDDPRLSGVLGRLKRVIERRYTQYGNPQQEVWIIAQRATRYA